ncbi:hypothetical protein PROVRUST_05620 [Providencia rustigianii DSM 4541]|uniref:Uncharacterized protein n=1 Tax=Providencia rustigianii DSM 4541 TaxID=500637 RepID=D1P0B0_9GAMM|nr:hypothetical protein PROVRUST_05620 [Providencia rustigianii DSM 4541]
MSKVIVAKGTSNLFPLLVSIIKNEYSGKDNVELDELIESY